KVLDLRLFWLKFWWIGFEILVRGSLVLLIVVFGSFLRGFPLPQRLLVSFVAPRLPLFP
ncbi:unnamed protein product, partial [Arabidopsis halleri]